MWLSLNIISKMVDISGISTEKLADKITMAAAEIDSVEYVNQYFKSVYTARVLEVLPHPNADKLTLVDLDTGKEKIRVVCGAPNHKKGDIVALATVGTKFSDEMVIKKTAIRGQESMGMLCSESELGLSEDHSGIMIFPVDTPVGVPLSELFPDFADIRFEIDNKSITHRPDLWSHAGFAREIGALTGKPVKSTVDFSLQKTLKNRDKLRVTIKNPDACPRYSGLAVKNIRIEESPSWLKAAVTSIGMRPINNIVDVTNYVMAEIGEPMHAFDRKKLRGDEIIVRMAGQGEHLMTLDGSEYSLSAEDIVIADAGGPIALAGVMGGGNSEIDESTTEIVLEAANFNPVNIRKTAHRYTQRTEAAIRFEKSLSPDLTIEALIRCYDLIKKCIPEAEAVTEIIDAYPRVSEKIVIETTTDFIRKRLGQNINDDEIIRIITSLDFTVHAAGPKLSIVVPHYRATKDISIPEDIVEEVGRIYGYDNIVPRAPLVTCVPPERNIFRTFERKTKEILSRNNGMTEISGYSFIGEEMLNRLKINEDKELKLSNPLSSEQDRLRRSLVPNIINAIVLNQRYHEKFRVYELNRVYVKEKRQSPELSRENTRTAGALYTRHDAGPMFYEAKNIVLNLLEKHCINEFSIEPVDDSLPPFCHPGRCSKVSVGGVEAGLIFELHPKTMKDFEINGFCSVFDIDLNVLYSAAKKETRFLELQKFPSVPFEISVIADKFAYAGELVSVIRGSDKNITEVDVISIYEGKPIAEGKKSISIKMVFTAKDKTFSPEEIEAMQNRVIKKLNKNGYELR